MQILRKTLFSPDRFYRYTLWREWDSTSPNFAQFIGLNPSTADETENDATIRRCIGFAKTLPKELRIGALCMTNLFAFKATLPSKLKLCPEPIGRDNDMYLINTAKEAAIVIATWGIHGQFMNRNDAVLNLIPNLHCFGKTAKGHPRHLVRLSRKAYLQTFRS